MIFMNDEKKKIPVPDPFDEGLENVSSATEMTGLIPANPDEETIFSYEKLFPYLPDYK